MIVNGIYTNFSPLIASAPRCVFVGVYAQRLSLELEGGTLCWSVQVRRVHAVMYMPMFGTTYCLRLVVHYHSYCI